jgi:hypothetical protein
MELISVFPGFNQGVAGSPGPAGYILPCRRIIGNNLQQCSRLKPIYLGAGVHYRSGTVEPHAVKEMPFAFCQQITPLNYYFMK